MGPTCAVAALAAHRTIAVAIKERCVPKRIVGSSAMLIWQWRCQRFGRFRNAQTALGARSNATVAQACVQPLQREQRVHYSPEALLRRKIDEVIANCFMRMAKVRRGIFNRRAAS